MAAHSASSRAKTSTRWSPVKVRTVPEISAVVGTTLTAVPAESMPALQTQLAPR
jgi:hypothetical protein